MIAIPCTVGVCVFAEPVLKLIFKSESSAELAAPKLSILSISIFFICVLSISNAVLQAHGKQRLPIISLVAGSASKLILGFVLIGIPQIGIYGAPISTVVCYMIATSFNIYFMAKYADVKPAVFLTFWKPLIASVVGVGVAFAALVGMSSFLPSRLATVAAIIITAVVYFIALFLIRGVEEDDIRMLPKGDKIFRVMQKLRFFKR